MNLVTALERKSKEKIRKSILANKSVGLPTLLQSMEVIHPLRNVQCPWCSQLRPALYAHQLWSIKCTQTLFYARLFYFF